MEESSFFNDVDGDRVYYAEDFAEYFIPFFTNGIFNNGCQVLGNSNDMAVNVSTGRAFIEGYRYRNPHTKTLIIDNADGVLGRIDNIVIRLDLTNRDITAQVIKGAFSNNPVAPDLVRTSTIYDLRIAKVHIPAGTTEITQDLIEDCRFITGDCGNVISPIKTPDTEQLFLQFEAIFNKFMNDNKNGFTTWFNEIQQEVDGFAKDKIVYYKQYKNTYITTQKNESTIPIGINQYNSRCMLEIYINGFRLTNNRYTIEDNNIILNEPLSEIGTEVHFIVSKVTIANVEDYDLLKGEPGESFTINLNCISIENPINASENDRYYNKEENKIYLYNDGNWNIEKTPEKGVIYVNLADECLYYYNGTDMIKASSSSKGIYKGDVPPTDEDVDVWLDTSDDPNNIVDSDTKGIIKQVKNISILKGKSLDDIDISKANQVILYYKNTSNPYYSSLVFPKSLSGQYMSVYGKDNIIGYFYIHFQSGRITNSPSSNEIFEIVGYDIVV